MKHTSFLQKITRTPKHISDREMCTRPNGTAIAPPAYGIEVVDRSLMIQRTVALSETTPTALPSAPSIVHEVLRSPDQPLDAASRAFFEPRFGVDFSQVRVHTDAQAAESARTLNALAYTVGRDVVFGTEQYTPHTVGGRRLIGHELAHVIQQGGNTTMPEQVSDPAEPAEREAANIATNLTVKDHIQPVEYASPGMVLRQAEGEGEARPQEKSPGFWGTIGGGLMGEFNEDPTFAMIGVDLGVSLVPVLDQASDVRDILAHLYYMIFKDQYNRFMRWLGLAFTLIGLIPVVGSAIKSASKFIIKGVREALSHLGDLLRPFQRLLPDMVDFSPLGRYVARNWNHWVTTGTAVWNRTVNRISRAINAIPSFLRGRAQFLRDGIARIQELAPQKLQEAFAWVRRQWDNITERLGRREGAAGAEASEATDEAARSGRIEEAAEIVTKQASQLPPELPSREIIGEAVRLTGPRKPLYTAKGEPIGAIPKKPPPLVSESGVPFKGARSKKTAGILDQFQRPVTKGGRRPRPTLFGPDDKPMRSTKGKEAKKQASSILGPGEKPIILGPTGKPFAVESQYPGKVLEPGGQQVIAGARVSLKEPVLTSKEWQGGFFSRGLSGEKGTIIKRYPAATALPQYFKTYDAVEGGIRRPVFASQKKGPLRSGEVIEGGTAISIKTANLSEQGYQTADGTFNNLNRYVDHIANFPKSGYTLSAKHPVTGWPHQVTLMNPSQKVLHIELSAVPTKEQMDGLARIRFEAAEKGIDVVFVAPK